MINNKVYVSNVKEKTKCYLYFDKNTCGSACEKILADNPIKAVRTNFDQPLTTNTTGTLFQASDDDGISYYYAGAVDNNWVKFGGFYWRIIRINGDGSIRMIYSGSEESGPVTTGETTQIGTSAFNETYYDNAYVGYMYGIPGSSTYEETHANINDSTIKTYIDNWYNNNLTNYNDYIDINAGFCGDRTIVKNPNYPGNGLSLASTIYGSADRHLNTNLVGWKDIQNVTLKCENTNDLFTTSNSNKGNKALNYPIGLITSDEANYVGLFGGKNNYKSYLYTGIAYWTMTPSAFGDGAYVFHIYETGALYIYYANSLYGVRPVINLRTDVTLTGIGTSSDPYIVS